MCDFSGKLIAWLDRELPDNEAADVERHLRACSECRSRVDAYEQVSSAFDAYCEAAIRANLHPRVPRWVPVLSAQVQRLLSWHCSSLCREHLSNRPCSILRR